MATPATPPAGATKISGPSGLAGLTEKDIWRDPNSKDIYRLAKPSSSVSATPPAGAVKISGPSGLQGLTESQIWRDPGSIDIYRLPDRPQNAAEVGDTAQARDYVNQQQDQDVALAEKGEAPPVRGIETITEDLKEQVVGDAERPEAPKYEETFTSLRGQYGINELETKLNDLNAQEEAVAAKYRYAIEDEEAKPVATNVIAGRQSEWEKQRGREMDAITRAKNTVINELNTKYGVVESIMKLKQMDYSAASSDYNSQFSQNLSLINAARGIQDSEKSEAERERDNARANLQIIQNSLSSGAVEELSPEQKVLARKLEVQAGLPVGFTESFKNKNPKADIVTTKSWQAPDGTEYVSIITANEDGSLSTENVKVGMGRLPSGGSGPQPTDADVLLYYKRGMTSQLQGVQGSDGYISPDDWKKARKAWGTTTPYTLEDFDKQFRSYANPEHLEDYEGFNEY